MRVIVVSSDLLFPTNSGGRAETLGMCSALRDAGIEVDLVVTHRESLPIDADQSHKSVARKLVFSQRSGFLRETIASPVLPYQLASRRRLTGTQVCSLASDEETVVVAVNEWTLPIAIQVASALDAPLVLRSQNDEVEYMRLISLDSGGKRKHYAMAESKRLRWALPRLYAKVQAVFCLSSEDCASYRNYGLSPVVVPPVLSSDGLETKGSTQANDGTLLLFLGALDMPHTVNGLVWFVEKVLPRVIEEVPSARLVVAGRRATAQLGQNLSASDGVEFLGEIPKTDHLLDRSRLFVNPIFAGSGVNMKIGPPSARGIPTVTTSKGARGLDKLRPGLAIADTEDEFVRESVRLLTDDVAWLENSRTLRNAFGEYSTMSVGQGLLRELNIVSRRFHGQHLGGNDAI